MNILWVTNIALPEASLLMNEKSTPFGGWFVSASTALVHENDIKLSISFPKKRLSNVLMLQGNKITFYAFPPVTKKEARLSKENIYLEKILHESNPDVVHIFGTEYPHTLTMLNACNKQNIKSIISIQGLTSIIAKHYLSGLPISIQNRFTFRDFLKQDNLKQQQRKFVERGKLEIEALQKVKHIIGRTTWDKACTYQINQNAQYHFCNEILRDEFYKQTWNINQCEKHSVFISQGSYPIKGLHFMLEAMPLILKQFPYGKLYIAGQNIIKSDTLKDKLKISSYGKYIKDLIYKYNIGKSVVFTGVLDEQKMVERYLRSHVFCCPSTIENSPNSVGEAMIFGVPCVASDVGGVATLLKHKEEGFVYQPDTPYMLAHYVCEIFANDELALQFSKRARMHAIKTHNKEENTKKMMEIYREIIGQSVENC